MIQILHFKLIRFKLLPAAAWRPMSSVLRRHEIWSALQTAKSKSKAANEGKSDPDVKTILSADASIVSAKLQHYISKKHDIGNAERSPLRPHSARPASARPGSSSSTVRSVSVASSSVNIPALSASSIAEEEPNRTPRSATSYFHQASKLDFESAHQHTIDALAELEALTAQLHLNHAIVHPLFNELPHDTKLEQTPRHSQDSGRASAFSSGKFSAALADRLGSPMTVSLASPTSRSRSEQSSRRVHSPESSKLIKHVSDQVKSQWLDRTHLSIEDDEELDFFDDVQPSPRFLTPVPPAITSPPTSSNRPRPFSAQLPTTSSSSASVAPAHSNFTLSNSELLTSLSSPIGARPSPRPISAAPFAKPSPRPASSLKWMESGFQISAHSVSADERDRNCSVSEISSLVRQTVESLIENMQSESHHDILSELSRMYGQILRFLMQGGSSRSNESIASMSPHSQRPFSATRAALQDTRSVFQPFSTEERQLLAHSLELLWKGFMLVYSRALQSFNAFQTRAHAVVPQFDLHFYPPSHPRAIAAREREPPVDETAAAIKATTDSRFPNMDLLRLHLQTNSLQKVNMNVQRENVQLSAQISSIRAQLRAIEFDTQQRLFNECAAAGDGLPALMTDFDQLLNELERATQEQADTMLEASEWVQSVENIGPDLVEQVKIHARETSRDVALQTERSNVESNSDRTRGADTITEVVRHAMAPSDSQFIARLMSSAPIQRPGAVRLWRRAVLRRTIYHFYTQCLQQRVEQLKVPPKITQPVFKNYNAPVAPPAPIETVPAYSTLHAQPIDLIGLVYDFFLRRCGNRQSARQEMYNFCLSLRMHAAANPNAYRERLFMRFLGLPSIQMESMKSLSNNQSSMSKLQFTLSVLESPLPPEALDFYLASFADLQTAADFQFMHPYRELEQMTPESGEIEVAARRARLASFNDAKLQRTRSIENSAPALSRIDASDSNSESTDEFGVWEQDNAATIALEESSEEGPLLVGSDIAKAMCNRALLKFGPKPMQAATAHLSRFELMSDGLGFSTPIERRCESVRAKILEHSNRRAQVNSKAESSRAADSPESIFAAHDADSDFRLEFSEFRLSVRALGCNALIVSDDDLETFFQSTSAESRSVARDRPASIPYSLLLPDHHRLVHCVCVDQALSAALRGWEVAAAQFKRHVVLQLQAGERSVRSLDEFAEALMRLFGSGDTMGSSTMLTQQGVIRMYRAALALEENRPSNFAETHGELTIEPDTLLHIARLFGIGNVVFDSHVQSAAQPSSTGLMFEASTTLTRLLALEQCSAPPTAEDELYMSASTEQELRRRAATAAGDESQAEAAKLLAPVMAPMLSSRSSSVRAEMGLPRRGPSSRALLAQKLV